MGEQPPARRECAEGSRATGPHPPRPRHPSPTQDAARLLAAAAAYHVSRTLIALRAAVDTATAAAPWRGRDAAAAAAAARRAGTAPTPPPRAVAALLARGADREHALDVRGAITAYEAAVVAAPDRADVLSAAAKAWSDAAYLDDLGVEPLSPTAKAALHERAIELCTAARAADPEAGLPHCACAVARGRLALVSDARTKAHLAASARADAVAAVTKAPDCDVAHHLIARWHFEMARLPRAVRAVVRLLYGASLEPGSFDAATAHYARAVELAPGRLIHRVELGRSLAKAGRYSDARAQLETALTLPVDDVNAHLQRVDAEIMLAALRCGNPARAWAGSDDAANLAAAEREAGVTATPATTTTSTLPPWAPRLPEWLPPPRPATFGLARSTRGAAATPRRRHKRRHTGGGRTVPGVK